MLNLIKSGSLTSCRSNFGWWSFRVRPIIHAVVLLVCAVLCCASCKHEEHSRKDQAQYYPTTPSTPERISPPERTIYEKGDSIRDFETNFKNLFQNWDTAPIVNAADFELKGYSFKEVIEDRAALNRYRNYFTSNQSLGMNMRKSSRSSANGGKAKVRMTLLPEYTYDPILNIDPKPEWYTPAFKDAVVKLVDQDFNIDTLELTYHSSMQKEEFSEQKGYSSDGSPNYIKHRAQKNFETYALGPLSEDYIQVFVTEEKALEELSLEAQQRILLAQLRNQRLTAQVSLSKNIAVGDVVYAIQFLYKEKPNEVFVICDQDSKKVLVDTFFSAIRY